MNKEKQLRLKALLGKIEELLPYASDEGGQRFMEAAVVFLPDLQKQKEKDDAAIGKLMAGNFDDLLKSVTKGFSFFFFFFFFSLTQSQTLRSRNPFRKASAWLRHPSSLPAKALRREKKERRSKSRQQASVAVL